MAAIAIHLRRQVIERARNRCEYCGMAQAGQEAAFHVDHVTPVSAGGKNALENLALACVSCSLRKGARQAAMNPQTRRLTPLFNPRLELWQEHFRWHGIRVAGVTPVGRTTVDALQMNRPLALAIRQEEIVQGRHPPPTAV